MSFATNFLPQNQTLRIGVFAREALSVGNQVRICGRTAKLGIFRENRAKHRKGSLHQLTNQAADLASLEGTKRVACARIKDRNSSPPCSRKRCRAYPTCRGEADGFRRSRPCRAAC